jgi:hypothetical protein
MELHIVIEGLPGGSGGEMLPVVVMTLGVAMVPNGAAGAIMDVETGLSTVDDDGTGIGVMEGDGRGGSAGGCGTGMVVPKKSDIDDAAGCADSVR